MKSSSSTTVPRSPRRTFAAGLGRLLGVALACGAGGCAGEISEGMDPRASAPSGSHPTDQRPAPSGDPTGVIKPAPGAAPVTPGTKGIHRLNAAEYNASIKDVLGTKLQPANSSWLGGELHGYDNMFEALHMSAEQYQKYLDAATAIADDVFATAELKAKVMVCTGEDDGCVQKIIETSGRRLFRRPLTTDEVGTFRKVYTAAKGQMEGHEGAAKQVLRALLASGEFLYRIELDPDPKSTAKRSLDGYELASRLSYFLWSSAPDDALLDAAADGSILQKDKLVATVDRMLADPVKGNRFIENFAGQWLGARKLPEHAAGDPDWSKAVATSLTNEMYLYFSEFLKSDRPWNEFMKADINFVDPGVAKLYGMSARTSGTGMTRVEIKDDKRYGFAGLGGFLAMSSLGERTSPTLRGRWVVASLLCIEPPPPPENAGDLGAGGLDPDKNVRAALEEHRKQPACAACHSIFDPYGLSLENFDRVGKYRTTYADGSPIDATAELPASEAFPQGVKFAGLDGMSDTVTKHKHFTECVADNLFVYGLGRPIVETDRPYLAAVQSEWKQGPLSLRRLIQSLVLAETFRFRHAAK